MEPLSPDTELPGWWGQEASRHVPLLRVVTTTEGADGKARRLRGWDTVDGPGGSRSSRAFESLLRHLPPKRVPRWPHTRHLSNRSATRVPGPPALGPISCLFSRFGMRGGFQNPPWCRCHGEMLTAFVRSRSCGSRPVPAALVLTSDLHPPHQVSESFSRGPSGGSSLYPDTEPPTHPQGRPPAASHLRAAPRP